MTQLVSIYWNISRATSVHLYISVMFMLGIPGRGLREFIPNISFELLQTGSIAN